jgi:hypothetical protein
VWGLDDTGGVSPLRLQRYQDFLAAVPEARARWLLNVHYVFSRQSALPDGEAIPSYTDPTQGLSLYRIREPGAPAYLVYAVQVEPDDSKALQSLAAAQSDPARVVVLAQDPGIALAGTGQGTVQVAERLPNRMRLEVETDAAGILVLSEIDYPGWWATVDGQRVPILRADTVLRAVAVGAGHHRVEMVFRPWTVWAGLALSVLTLVLGAAGMAWCWKARA